MSKNTIRLICLILAVLMVFSLFAYVLTSGASAVTQAEIDTLQRERDSLKYQQEDIQEQIDLLTAEKSSAMERKSVLDQQLALNWKDIQLVDQQIRLYDELIAEKAVEVEQAVADEDAQLLRYKARVRAMEESTPWTYLSIILQATSLTDFLSRLSDVTDILRNDRSLRDEYIAARTLAQQVQQEYEEAQARQVEKRQELDAQKQALALQVEQASNLIAFLEDDIDTFAAAYEEKEAMQAQVQSRIDQKVIELQEQQEAERKARAAYEERLRQQQQERERQERERQEAERLERERQEAERLERERQEAERLRQEQQAQTQAETQPDSEPVPEPQTESDSRQEPVPEPQSTETPVQLSGELPDQAGFFQWPSSTTLITSRHGNRIHPIFGTTKWHSGVDIGAAYGDTVMAAAGGTVEIAEYSDSYGYYVVIYHSNGTTTLYAHMNSAPLVSVGDTVLAGDPIGYVGSTGWATAAHLHFEIRVNGSTVDPLEYFPGISFSFTADA